MSLLGEGAESAWLLLVGLESSRVTGRFLFLIFSGRATCWEMLSCALMWWQGMPVMASGSHVIARKQPQASPLEPHHVPAYLCHIS